MWTSTVMVGLIQTKRWVLLIVVGPVMTQSVKLWGQLLTSWMSTQMVPHITLTTLSASLQLPPHPQRLETQVTLQVLLLTLVL